MMIRQIVHDDRYLSDIIIQVGGSLKQLNKYYSKITKTEELDVRVRLGALGAFISVGNQKTGALWFDKNTTPEVIAHECYCATCHVLQSEGIDESAAPEEVCAYLLTFLVRKTHELKERLRNPNDTKAIL